MTVMDEPVLPGANRTCRMPMAARPKWFHWVTVVLLAIAMPVGFVISHIKDADKGIFYTIHESAGLTILFVALARLAWRLTNPPKPLPEHVPLLLRKTRRRCTIRSTCC